MGAKKAGEKSIESVQKQIEYAEIEKKQETEAKRKKFEAFFNGQLLLMKHKLKSIDFLMGLFEHHNIFNVDPITEIKKNLRKIDEILYRLNSWDPEYISLSNIQLIGELSNDIHEIERSYEGVIATEEEQEKSISRMRTQCGNLMKKISNFAP